MKPPFTVTLNLNNESGVCAGATSWPFHPSVEVTNHSLSFHLTDVTRLTRTDQRTAGSGGLYLRSSLKNSGLVNARLYILMCNRQSFHQTADRFAFIGGGYFFLMVERTHNKDKWFLHLPFSPSSLSPSVSNSQAACFLLHLSSLLIYLSSHHTHLSPLCLTLSGLPLCEAGGWEHAEHCAPPLNGAACEWQQHVSKEQ